MAKTLEDLAESRRYRAEVLNYFGNSGVPESILRHDRSDRAIDLMVTDGDRDYGSTGGNDIYLRGHHIASFEISGRGVRFGALSRFPQSVGRTLLLLYSLPGDTVVDPFAGHNSRMELCWRSNRNYIGCDISHEFMCANIAIRDMLREEKSTDLFGEHFKGKITLFECDSRTMPIRSNTGDFTITSPPYWDLEHYGDEPGQIGTGKTYDEFLQGLSDIMKENFRTLKPGAFAVWCVNDFRKDKKFYSYHEHTAQLLRDAGFDHHDTCITDLGNSMHSAFVSRLLELKILAKRHEYCLIMRKPCADAIVEKVNGMIAVDRSKPPIIDPGALL